MTRKRFVKLMMGRGFDRNTANAIACLVKITHLYKRRENNV